MHSTRTIAQTIQQLVADNTNLRHTPLKNINGLINPHILRFKTDTSIWDAMRDIRGFVGESVPIIEPENNHLIGVLVETDLIEAYLKSVKTLRNEETANA